MVEWRPGDRPWPQGCLPRGKADTEGDGGLTFGLWGRGSSFGFLQITAEDPPGKSKQTSSGAWAMRGLARKARCVLETLRGASLMVRVPVQGDSVRLSSCPFPTPTPAQPTAFSNGDHRHGDMGSLESCPTWGRKPMKWHSVVFLLVETETFGSGPCPLELTIL